MATATVPKELEDAVNAFRKLQQEAAQLLDQKRQFGSRMNENELVKQEMDLLDDDAEVFKLIGPVLVKQDVSDAKATVNSRMDLLKRELARVDEQLAAKEKEMEAARSKVMGMQASYQRAAAGDGTAEAK